MNLSTPNSAVGEPEVLGRPCSQYSPEQLANIMASDNIAESRLDSFGPLIFRELASRLDEANLPSGKVKNLYRFFLERQSSEECLVTASISGRKLTPIEHGKMLVTSPRTLQRLIADQIRQVADAMEQGTVCPASQYSIVSDQIALAFSHK